MNARSVRRAGLLAAGLSASLVLAACGSGSSGDSADQPVVGLITKTDTNPFFVKMREGAEAKAKGKGEPASPQERMKQWWSSARTFTPREDDAKSDVVQCKIGRTVRFTSQSDCANSGGRVAGG